MKNICKIHPLCYIVVLIYVITGTFRPFIWIMSLIIVHELGHVITGLIFNWKIEKITIMPVGGITIFKESLNRPIKEELLIALAGPLFQLVYFLLVKDFVQYEWFVGANTALLLFNLLPIIPLDGSKILHCLLDTFLAFDISNNITIIISFIMLLFGIVICIITHNLIISIAVLCITIKVIEEYKNKTLRFQKFTLERFLNEYHFNKTKKIKKEKEMYRNYKHLFYVNSHWITEKSYLIKKFNR